MRPPKYMKVSPAFWEDGELKVNVKVSRFGVMMILLSMLWQRIKKGLPSFGARK